MDSLNGVWTVGTFIHLVWILRESEYLVIDCIVMGDATPVGFNEPSVDQSLSMLPNGVQISDQWNVQYHVT